MTIKSISRVSGDYLAARLDSKLLSSLNIIKQHFPTLEHASNKEMREKTGNNDEGADERQPRQSLVDKMAVRGINSTIYHRRE